MFEHGVDTAENAAPDRTFGVFVWRFGQLVEQLPQLIIGLPAFGLEGVECNRALDDSAISPAFRACKQTFGRTVIGAELCEFHAQRCRIDMTHQFAY